MEGGFNLLQGRWRIFLKTLDLKLANVLDIVGTNKITIKGIVLRVLIVIVSTSVS